MSRWFERSWLRGLCLVGLAAVALVGSRSARADAADGAEPLRLEFHAPSGCPDGDALLRAVRARTPRVRVAASGESARMFVVTIREEAGKLHGELSVIEPDEPRRASAKRVIVGESCRDVCDALSLFAALSMDPAASTAALPALPPAPESNPEAPVAPAPASTEPRAPTLDEWRARPEGNAPRLESRRTVAGSRLRALGGASFGVLGANAASSLFFGAPFLGLGWSDSQAKAFAVAPDLRISVLSTGGSSQPSAQGPAHLHLTSVRLDGCPFELHISQPLSVRPCVTASVGLLSARGETIAHPKAQSLTWGTLGGLTRVQWSIVDLVVLELSTGVELPLRRDEFYFEPSTPVYEVPPLLGWIAAGVGVHFP